MVNDGSFKNIGIFTSRDTVTSKKDEIEALRTRHVKVHVGDITSDEDVNAAYTGYDTVVSCVGRPVIHTQLKLVELADKHPDIKRFFPSEYGTDIEYGPQSQHERKSVPRAKGDIRLE